MPGKRILEQPQGLGHRGTMRRGTARARRGHWARWPSIHTQKTPNTRVATPAPVPDSGLSELASMQITATIEGVDLKAGQRVVAHGRAC